MGYLLTDYVIIWTDNGPIVRFKSPFNRVDLPLPGPIVSFNLGTTRSQILKYFKNFNCKMQVTLSHEPIEDIVPISDIEQLLVDTDTGEIAIDEFGCKVYVHSKFMEIPEHTLIDLRYD